MKHLKDIPVPPEKIRSILVVCTGNICRSPMAEAVLRERLKEEDYWRTEVSSAGTLNLVNEPASAPAIESCRKIGIHIKKHRSSPLTPERVQAADLILVMERHHLDFIAMQYPNALGKTFLLGAFTEDGEDGEIDDPIGMTMNFYVETLAKICRSVDGFVEWMNHARPK